MIIIRAFLAILLLQSNLDPNHFASFSDSFTAGYATSLTDPSVDGVATHFTVPNTWNDCGSDAQTAIWVGLGGNFNSGPGNTFVQSGISLNPTSPEITGAWYELWQNSTSNNPTYFEYNIPFTANAGDTVWLRLQWGDAHRKVYMQWRNNTTNQNVTRIVDDPNLYQSGDIGAEAMLENAGSFNFGHLIHFDHIDFFYARELSSDGTGLDQFGIPNSTPDGGLVPSTVPPIPPASQYWESIRYYIKESGILDLDTSAPVAGTPQQFTATWMNCQ